MLLAIDAGNSQIKLAIFSNDQLLEKTALIYTDNDFEAKLNTWLSKDVEPVGLVSVNKSNLKDKIKSISKKKVFNIDYKVKFPFKIDNESPKTIGIDRLAACTGAHTLNNGKGNFLVIDAGTCITYDLVNDSNVHIGGAISPGISIRSKSLERYTANLPRVAIDKKATQVFGKSTHEAIRSGIVNGLLYEIQGYINQIHSNHSEVKVFLTGGDAFFFEDALKSSIFAEDNLVLIGINKLIKINA